MSDKLTGYEASRQWFNFAFDTEHRILPIHTAIYFFAYEHQNRLGGAKVFGFPSQMTMDAIGVKNYSTYIKAFRELIDWGFIKLIEKSTNQYSSNRIALLKYDKALSKALDKALVKHSAKQRQSIVSINKQVNKETNKQVNDNYSSFEKFFGLYPKHKGNKRLARDLWLELDSEEIKAIFATVETFVKNNINYLPMSDNYLRDQRWKDVNTSLQKSSGAKMPTF